MNRAAELRREMDGLVILAVEIDRLGLDSYATSDVLARLHAEIRSTRREILREDAAALLRAAHNSGPLQ